MAVARDRTVRIALKFMYIVWFATGALFMSVPFLYDFSAHDEVPMSITERVISGVVAAAIGGMLSAFAAAFGLVAILVWWSTRREPISVVVAGAISSIALCSMSGYFVWYMISDHFIAPLFGDGYPLNIW